MGIYTLLLACLKIKDCDLKSIWAHHDSWRVSRCAAQAPSAVIQFALIFIFELDALSIQVVKEEHPNISSPVNGTYELFPVASNQLKIIDRLAIIIQINNFRFTLYNLLCAKLQLLEIKMVNMDLLIHSDNHAFMLLADDHQIHLPLIQFNTILC